MNLAQTTLTTGPGLPIVFLHGFLGTAADWEPICSFLPESHCVGLDLPGHGHSPFIEDFIIDIPRFHLVGYSMGGRLALMYQVKHPNQVASLTLLSTHPGLETAEEKKERLIHDTKWAQKLIEKPIEQFLHLWYSQPIFDGFKPDLTRRMKQNIPNLSAALLHYSLAKQPRFHVKEMLVGERDVKFRNLIQNPIIIPHSGHALHLENPKAVAEILSFMIS